MVICPEAIEGEQTGPSCCIRRMRLELQQSYCGDEAVFGFGGLGFRVVEVVLVSSGLSTYPLTFKIQVCGIEDQESCEHRRCSPQADRALD